MTNRHAALEHAQECPFTADILNADECRSHTDARSTLPCTTDLVAGNPVLAQGAIGPGFPAGSRLGPPTAESTTKAGREIRGQSIRLRRKERRDDASLAKRAMASTPR